MEPRAATPQDASAMAQLWLEATAEVALHEPIYTPGINHDHLTQRLAGELLEETKRGFVVYMGEVLAGYVTFRAEEESPVFLSRRYVYVCDLDVAPQFRGQGLSHLLMNKVEAYARANQIHRIELSVAFADLRAKAVWERHGFKPHMLLLHKDL